MMPDITQASRAAVSLRRVAELPATWRLSSSRAYLMCLASSITWIRLTWRTSGWTRSSGNAMRCIASVNSSITSVAANISIGSWNDPSTLSAWYSSARGQCVVRPNVFTIRPNIIE